MVGSMILIVPPTVSSVGGALWSFGKVVGVRAFEGDNTCRGGYVLLGYVGWGRRAGEEEQ
jgi:hypothetical protein